MKLLHFSALFIFASLFYTGTATTTTNRHSNKTEVSIKGRYTTISERLSPPPLVQVRITGIGQSSHLGHGTFVALSTLNVGTTPPFSIGGTCTFTAANKDEFYTSFTGTAMPNPDGTMTVEMTHNITGGTGRFTDATGEIKGYTITSPTEPEAQIDYEGHISY